MKCHLIEEYCVVLLSVFHDFILSNNKLKLNTECLEKLKLSENLTKAPLHHFSRCKNINQGG